MSASDSPEDSAPQSRDLTRDELLAHLFGDSSAPQPNRRKRKKKAFSVSRAPYLPRRRRRPRDDRVLSATHENARLLPPVSDRVRPKTSTGIGSAAAMGRALQEERRSHEEGVRRLKCRLNASQKFTEFVSELCRAQEEMQTKDRATAMDLARETGYQRLAAYINSDSAVPFDDLVAETKATSGKILDSLTNQTHSKSKVLGDLQRWFTRVFEEGSQEEFIMRQNRVEDVIGAYTPDALTRDMRRRAHRLSEVQRAFERASQGLKEELINQRVEEERRAQDRQKDVRRDLQLAATKREQLEEDLQKAIDRYEEVDTRNKALTRMMERFEEEKSNWGQKITILKTKLNLRIQELEKQSAILEIEKKKKGNEMMRMQNHFKQESEEKDRECERKLEEQNILSQRAIREANAQMEAMKRDLAEANAFAKTMAEENRSLRTQIREGGVRLTEDGSIDKIDVQSTEVQTTAPTYASKIRVRQRLLKGLESFVEESKKTVFQIQFGSSVVVDRLSKVVSKRIPSDLKRFVTNLCLDNGIHPKEYLDQLASLVELLVTRVEKLADDHHDKVEEIMQSSHAKTFQNVVIEESEKAMFMGDASSALTRARAGRRNGHRADAEAIRRHFVAQLLKEKEELKDEVVERDERIFRLQEQVFEEIEKRKRTKFARTVPTADGTVQTEPVHFSNSFRGVSRRTPFVAPPVSPNPSPASPTPTGDESNPSQPTSPVPTQQQQPQTDAPPPVITFETGIQCDLAPASGRRRSHSTVTSARKRSGSRSGRGTPRVSESRASDDAMFTKNLQIVLYETENVELRCDMRRVSMLLAEEEKVRKRFERSNRHLQQELDDLKQELLEEREERAKAEKDAFDSILGNSAIRSIGSDESPSPSRPGHRSILEAIRQDSPSSSPTPSARSRQSSTSRTVDMMRSHSEMAIDPAKIEKVMEELEFSQSANEFLISRVDELIEEALTTFADLHILPPSQVDLSASFLSDRPDDFVCLQLSELHQRVVCLFESLKIYIEAHQASQKELMEEKIVLAQKNAGLLQKAEELKILRASFETVLEEKRQLEMKARWEDLDNVFDSSLVDAAPPTPDSVHSPSTTPRSGIRPATANPDSPPRKKSRRMRLRSSSSSPSFSIDTVSPPRARPSSSHARRSPAPRPTPSVSPLMSESSDDSSSDDLVGSIVPPFGDVDDDGTIAGIPPIPMATPRGQREDHLGDVDEVVSSRDRLNEVLDDEMTASLIEDFHASPDLQQTQEAHADQEPPKPAIGSGVVKVPPRPSSEIEMSVRPPPSSGFPRIRVSLFVAGEEQHPPKKKPSSSVVPAVLDLLRLSRPKEKVVVNDSAPPPPQEEQPRVHESELSPYRHRPQTTPAAAKRRQPRVVHTASPVPKRPRQPQVIVRPTSRTDGRSSSRSRSREQSRSRSRSGSRPKRREPPLILVESPADDPPPKEIPSRRIETRPVVSEPPPDEFYQVAQVLSPIATTRDSPVGRGTRRRGRLTGGPSRRKGVREQGGRSRRTAAPDAVGVAVTSPAAAKEGPAARVRPRTSYALRSAPLQPTLPLATPVPVSAKLSSSLLPLRPGETPVDIRTFKRAVAVLQEDRNLTTQKVSATFHAMAERKKLLRLQAELYSLELAASRGRASVSRRAVGQLRRMLTFQESKLKKWVRKKEMILERKRVNLEKGLAALRVFVMESEVAHQRKSSSQDPLLLMTSYSGSGRRVKKRRIRFPNSKRSNPKKAFYAHPKVQRKKITLPYL